MLQETPGAEWQAQAIAAQPLGARNAKGQQRVGAAGGSRVETPSLGSCLLPGTARCRQPPAQPPVLPQPGDGQELSQSPGVSTQL